MSYKVENGHLYKLVFCKSINRKGKTIYPNPVAAPARIRQ